MQWIQLLCEISCFFFFTTILFASNLEETFGGQLVPNSSEVQRVCQCDAVSSRRSRPLVVPSNETRLISADNVSRSSARAMSEEGRFIRPERPESVVHREETTKNIVGGSWFRKKTTR